MLAQDLSLINYAGVVNKRKSATMPNRDAAEPGAGAAEESKHQASVDLVRVLLYTNGGLCNKFFNGISATNLYRENTIRLMIERYIRHICRFNVYLDAIVEKCEVPALQGKTLSGISPIENNSIPKTTNSTTTGKIEIEEKPI